MIKCFGVLIMLESKFLAGAGVIFSIRYVYLDIYFKRLPNYWKKNTYLNYFEMHSRENNVHWKFMILDSQYYFSNASGTKVHIFKR